MIVTYEEIESIIDEWFTDYAIKGKVEIAKLYASIMNCCEKNLHLFLEESEVEN